jgi:hypothetical protein
LADILLFILGYIFNSNFYAKDEAQLKEQEEDRTTVLMPVQTLNCLHRQENELEDNHFNFIVSLIIFRLFLPARVETESQEGAGNCLPYIILVLHIP